MHLLLKACEIRSWQSSDLEPLVTHANNRSIWLNLRDRFPHPYMARDGRAFLKHMREQQPETAFAIAVNGEAAGSIAFQLGGDVERVSAEIGYWLGQPFWGRGIATEALVAITEYAVATHGLTRVFAVPFASNTRSCRVLEKAGYVLEGRLRRSAVKDGVITDQLQYAFNP
jgi:[ribosomal protein S5]-alanine N-acetyltransferase